MKRSWKVKEVLKALKNDGWFEVPSRGGHRQLKHSIKPGRVTVPGKQSETLRRKTVNSIFLQAELERPR